MTVKNKLNKIKNAKLAQWMGMWVKDFYSGNGFELMDWHKKEFIVKRLIYLLNYFYFYCFIWYMIDEIDLIIKWNYLLLLLLYKKNRWIL